MRILYTLLWTLALPLLPLRLWWRGRREPGYLEAIGERFGRYRGDVKQPVIWIHAVSLGETRAATPLVERVLREHPEATVLLTHMTATGRAAGKAQFGDRVVQAWLPYDLPFAARRFLAAFRPRVGLLLETEVWPNLIAEAGKQAIPLYLVNARLSERSARGYGRVPALARGAFGGLSGVAAQAIPDAQRLADLGSPPPFITGNIKFDIGLSPAAAELGTKLRGLFGSSRKVLIAGSTRDGEEALLLDALAAKPLPPDALVVVVPRHPQRFDAVAQLLKDRGFDVARRSANLPVPESTRFVLGDSMGEMMGYFAAADVAFIGGSLLPLGGQNLIEPIAAGVPTIVGPHMFNFAEATALALQAGAAISVPDAAALVRVVLDLLEDEPRRRQLREAALAFHATHRGATDRLWSWLAPRIDAALAAGDPAAQRINPATGG